MSDTSVTIDPPPPPTTPSQPMQAGDPGTQPTRDSQGNIQEPSQTPPTTLTTSGDPAPTSTSDAKDGKDSNPTGAPETYADFRAPDGYTLDPKSIEAATPIFRELGLSQDQAQRLVEFHAAQMIEAAKAPQATYEQTRTEWRTQVEADPELKAAVSGGKSGLEAVKLDIGRALNALGDNALVGEFRQAMDLTGVGDNPAFIKAMYKLSQFVTEGKHVQGSQPSPHGQRAPGTTDRPAPAKSLYPNLS